MTLGRVCAHQMPAGHVQEGAGVGVTRELVGEASASSTCGAVGGGAAAGGEEEEAGKAVQRWAADRQKLAMRLIIGGELLHILRPLMYTLALRR